MIFIRKYLIEQKKAEKEFLEVVKKSSPRNKKILMIWYDKLKLNLTK